MSRFFNFSRFLDFLKSLPRAVRFGVPAIIFLLVLAVVVGMIARPASTPATVSTVRPTVGPAALQQQPSSPLVAAPAPAAPPVPQTGGGATSAVVMRPALPPRPLRDCARSRACQRAGAPPWR